MPINAVRDDKNKLSNSVANCDVNSVVKRPFYYWCGLIIQGAVHV